MSCPDSDPPSAVKHPAQANTNKLNKTIGTPQVESAQPSEIYGNSRIGRFEEHNSLIGKVKASDDDKKQRGGQKMSLNIISIVKARALVRERTRDSILSTTKSLR